MSTLLQVVVFSLLGGVVSLIGGVFLLRKKSSAVQLAKYATPFAAGALLAAVFLDLLVEGIHVGAAEELFVAVLLGILLFFVAERFLRWFHHHHQHGATSDPTASLIIAGDTLHNALDGIVIGAAFIISPATGIITTLAVAAHEIPQEIGDFGLLLHKGLARRKVLLLNVISALATTVMAVLTFALGSEDQLPLGWLIGFSAGFLLYIAMSDIIPDIHENTSSKQLFSWQPVLLILGVVVVGTLIQLTHSFMGH